MYKKIIIPIFALFLTGCDENYYEVGMKPVSGEVLLGQNIEELKKTFWIRESETNDNKKCTNDKFYLTYIKYTLQSYYKVKNDHLSVNNNKNMIWSALVGNHNALACGNYNNSYAADYNHNSYELDYHSYKIVEKEIYELSLNKKNEVAKVVLLPRYNDEVEKITIWADKHIRNTHTNLKFLPPQNLSQNSPANVNIVNNIQVQK